MSDAISKECDQKSLRLIQINILLKDPMVKDRAALETERADLIRWFYVNLPKWK